FSDALPRLKYEGVVVRDGAIPLLPSQVSVAVFPILFPSHGPPVGFPALRLCIAAPHVPPRNERVRLPDATAIMRHRDAIPVVRRRVRLPPPPQESAPREKHSSPPDRW